jgi:hypothetical protein
MLQGKLNIKRPANSANAIEDIYSNDCDRSMARRALIYTLLREFIHRPRCLCFCRSMLQGKLNRKRPYICIINNRILTPI